LFQQFVPIIHKVEKVFDKQLGKDSHYKQQYEIFVI